MEFNDFMIYCLGFENYCEKCKWNKILKWRRLMAFARTCDALFHNLVCGKQSNGNYIIPLNNCEYISMNSQTEI